MVEWKELKEVFETRNGYTPSTANESFWNGGNIPWFKMEDIRDNGNILNDSYLHITDKAIKGKGLFKANSILLATSATIGEHALIEVEHLSNQRFTNFYPKKEYEQLINMRYAYYYMFIIDEWCRQHVNQGGFASVDMSGLYNQLFPIPSLSEQQRIVEQLDTFTSSIENLKEQIAQRRKQYEYYRDQLLDLEGKEGVEMKTLSDICEIKGRIGFRGYTRKDQVDKGEGALSLTATNITNQRIDYRNNTYITWEKYYESPEIMVKNGDIIVCQRGSIGKIAYVENLPEKATINPQLLLIKNVKISNKYLIHVLLSRYFQEELSQIIGHGTVQMIAQKDFKNLLAPVPSLSEQQRIVSILDTFEASVANLEQQLALREKQYEYYRNKLLTFE